ncbi:MULTISPECIES: iron-sulfur cluster carrier protein ApbC [unclassified Moraxella]|uniref:iron-sulfur cluster carrier protein ApbC n=1 Tax=unclassified Moraxella TaxID=2685852 RepID=UPI003AF569DE
MFNFKKNKPTLNQAEIDNVLQNHLVNGTPLSEFLTKTTQNGTVLTLDLRLPDDCNAEQIHHELSQRLHLLGVSEINMNVTLFKAELKTENPQKGDSKTLPKTTNAMPQPKKVQAQAQAHTTETDEPPITKKATAQSDLTPHPRIQHIIVVASGKGGVGKSTTTVNIALALQKLGKKVGVLDADIYGPSIPTMLGVAGVQPTLENEQFVPIDAQGMPMLSIGSLLTDDNTPIAWRGAKATGALMQLYNQTNWPNLDYLVIDMPPGTGDIQLTLAQRIPVTGAVVVTTPQHIALLDAQKGIEMFRKTAIPVLGVVENMALHTCSNCGHTEAIFGEGGGEKMAENYQVPLLGQLPLAKGIREQADKGEPSVLVNDEFAEYYLNIAKNIEANIGKFAKSHDNNRIF